MVNKPLIRPYFCGGYVRGGRLGSHEKNSACTFAASFTFLASRMLVPKQSRQSHATSLTSPTGGRGNSLNKFNKDQLNPGEMKFLRPPGDLASIFPEYTGNKPGFIYNFIHLLGLQHLLVNFWPPAQLFCTQKIPK